MVKLPADEDTAQKVSRTSWTKYAVVANMSTCNSAWTRSSPSWTSTTTTSVSGPQSSTLYRFANLSRAQLLSRSSRRDRRRTQQSSRFVPSFGATASADVSFYRLSPSMTDWSKHLPNISDISFSPSSDTVPLSPHFARLFVPCRPFHGKEGSGFPSHRCRSWWKQQAMQDLRTLCSRPWEQKRREVEG